MPTAIKASDYSIELRDKDGNLKRYLTPFVSKASWEWNRLGGCGRCSITINKGYRDIIFDARDDIQIRVNDLGDVLYKTFSDIDDEDMADITDWTDADTGTGASTQATFDSKSCMKLDTGNDIGMAKRRQDIGTFGGKTAFMFSSYFENIGTMANGDYAAFAAFNGIIGVSVVFCSDGLYVYGGTTYNEVGTNIVVQDTWQKWAFVVNWTAQTVDIYKDDALVATNVDCGCASAIANGTVDIYQCGATITYCITYIDYFKAGNVPESKLVYRGFIANITPTLKINQDIVLDVRGYFDLFKKLIVHTTGDTRTYTSKTIGFIADDIADIFIVPNTPITIAGALTAGSFTVDSIDFLCTVDDALRTLSEMDGTIEYGVDENLVFYWTTESETINHRFFVGNNISILERRVNWDDLVNKIYLVGGDVAGAKYKKTAQDTGSQALYYLAEEILNNSSIVTDSVAAQYMGAILLERSTPKYSICATIKNTDIRMEDTIPMGQVSFYDVTYDRNSFGDNIGDIIGETADGGSNITIGETGEGGSNVTIGGSFIAQVDRISYELSDTSGRFEIKIQLGDTVLETAAKIKRLELAMASVTQY